MHITNDDKKPSIDEALQHYGVPGMKWGVRKKSDRPAKKKHSELRREDKETRAARKSMVKKRKAEFKKADTFAKKADIALMGEFAKSLSDNYRADPERAIAFRMTNGRKAVLAVLAVPTGGASLGAGMMENVMMRQVQRDQETMARVVKKK